MIHYITTNGIGDAWIAAELRVVEQEGVPFRLHSMRPPHQTFYGSTWADCLNSQTEWIYPLPPVRAALSFLVAPFLFGKRFYSALWSAIASKRESLRNRVAVVAHFFVACHWARSLRNQEVTLIHSQWIHSGGTIGMYGSWLLGVPFSFTGHAVDLFRDRVALDEKINRADFIVCISNFHREFYLERGARADQLFISYCGIDVEQFVFQPRDEQPQTPHILSVGRLVEKKGFEYVIDACAILKKRRIPHRCTIAGAGPLEEILCQRVRDQKLDDVVQVTGQSVMQEDLPNFLATGDVFVQPCVWSSDNDVDGTPRTLMEAMACGLPSVATRIAGIPDIIEDEVSGLLVHMNDAISLANAVERLIVDRQLSDRISREGRRQIELKFKLPDCVYPTIKRFQEKLRVASGETTSA